MQPVFLAGKGYSFRSCSRHGCGGNQLTRRALARVAIRRSGAPFASSKSICVQACSLQASPSVSKSATETVMEAEVRAQILTGGRGDQPRKSGCCQGHREQLCEWQSRSAHKCEGGGWRMTQGLVVENEREYFVGRQKLCYLLWTWSCRCRCQMYCFEL